MTEESEVPLIGACFEELAEVGFWYPGTQHIWLEILAFPRSTFL
jgi:hypothetical protein